MDQKSGQYTSGTAEAVKFHSVDQVARAQAQEKLSQMSADDLLRSLRAQGIGSLEDLAQATVEAVRTTASSSGGRGSLVLLDDVLPYCYKFTTARPFFNEDVLRGLGEFARG